LQLPICMFPHTQVRLISLVVEQRFPKPSAAVRLDCREQSKTYEVWPEG